MGRPRGFDDAAVVDAAMEAFWSKGYEATSTEDLCVCTGLGRGSLYNAYGSKHGLYERVLHRYAERGFGEQLVILQGPGAVKERLRALMLAVIDFDLADPARRGCLAVNAAVGAGGTDDLVAQQVRRQFGRLEAAVCHLITCGQRDGELVRDVDPLISTRFFISAYYGLRVLGKVTHDRRALEDVVDGVLARL
ncbi:TetR/AcrR family transcriptional regulator [Actinosynnema sp. NPDC047251]|uniref:Transcriptional regulator, TetR family n=1 Tax=Saccharothrix espanaensis (strain ATCC 51144 / DSM 44229 / JCM 9112 / NBRC 15066 / NRRL 15764) TaxID=1179773 RepID=K0K8U3_SACES|nr:TetR/AcrR family transcriptional regulator [Saccharothrix espanaensis]CCH33967.1 Transcriptional regulator, TetR family [Saccharothrix espanaensis DSM 44229]